MQASELRCFDPPRSHRPSAIAAALRSDRRYQNPLAAAVAESCRYRGAESCGWVAAPDTAVPVAEAAQAGREVSAGSVPAPACGDGSHRVVGCNGYTYCSPA